MLTTDEMCSFTTMVNNEVRRHCKCRAVGQHENQPLIPTALGHSQLPTCIQFLSQDITHMDICSAKSSLETIEAINTCHCVECTDLTTPVLRPPAMTLMERPSGAEEYAKQVMKASQV